MDERVSVRGLLGVRVGAVFVLVRLFGFCLPRATVSETDFVLVRVTVFVGERVGVLDLDCDLLFDSGNVCVCVEVRVGVCVTFFVRLAERVLDSVFESVCVHVSVTE